MKARIYVKDILVQFTYSIYFQHFRWFVNVNHVVLLWAGALRYDGPYGATGACTRQDIRNPIKRDTDRAVQISVDHFELSRNDSVSSQIAAVYCRAEVALVFILQ
jgi:hypothetical protein